MKIWWKIYYPIIVISIALVTLYKSQVKYMRVVFFTARDSGSDSNIIQIIHASWNSNRSISFFRLAATLYLFFHCNKTFTEVMFEEFKPTINKFTWWDEELK